MGLDFESEGEEERVAEQISEFRRNRVVPPYSVTWTIEELQRSFALRGLEGTYEEVSRQLQRRKESYMLDKFLERQYAVIREEVREEMRKEIISYLIIAGKLSFVIVLPLILHFWGKKQFKNLNLVLISLILILI